MLNFFASRKLHRQVSEHFRPESVQKVLDEPAVETRKFFSYRIAFIFVFVHADTPQQLNDRIGLVIDAGKERQAIAIDLMGPMVVMGFCNLGFMHSAGPRQRFVDQLHQRHGAAIKIVHGAADGHLGKFGNARRNAFTFTFPSFDEALATLVRLNFGCTEELLP
jgi:hypothetical protein